MITAIVSILIGSGITYFLMSPTTTNQAQVTPVYKQISQTPVNNDAPTVTPSRIAQPTSPTIKKTGSEIISIDATYNEYHNYDFGFAITYPKMPRGNANCINRDDHTLQLTQVIEDLDNKAVYIAYKKEALNSLNNSCIVKDITLDTIINGIPASSGSSKFITPQFYPIKFTKVSTDSSIINFVTQTYFHSDVSSQFPCQIKQRTPITNINGVYTLTFSNNGNDITSLGCNINFNSQTIYSEPNHFVVTSSIGQSPVFGGDYRLEVSFLK